MKVLPNVENVIIFLLSSFDVEFYNYAHILQLSLPIERDSFCNTRYTLSERGHSLLTSRLLPQDFEDFVALNNYFRDLLVVYTT